MDTAQRRLDLLAFLVALSLLAGPTIAFVAERNGGAVIMCAMCLAGLVAARIIGVPGRVLLPVAFGILAVLCMLWINSPFGARKTSALAHAIGGTLAGWAAVEALRHRIGDWRAVALLALSGVIVLTLAWELGEYAGDLVFGTSLNPSARNSAEDIVFGTAGGFAGVILGSFVAFGRRSP